MSVIGNASAPIPWLDLKFSLRWGACIAADCLYPECVHPPQTDRILLAALPRVTDLDRPRRAPCATYAPQTPPLATQSRTAARASRHRPPPARHSLAPPFRSTGTGRGHA